MRKDIELFGTWEELTAVSHTHHMAMNAADLSTHWRRCSLSSDFWAKYTALGVETAVSPPKLPRNAIESVLSYLLNELFENTAKFSSGPEQSASYQAWLSDEMMHFQLRNHIKPEDKAPFVDLIQELLNSDPDELYFEKLEANAESNASGSGLGYLTLIKDYSIQFGFRFQQLNAESIAVDVQAHVSMDEVD